jgi:hypothetical protein
MARMVDFNRIDRELVEQVTTLARRRDTSPEAIVEDALRAFLLREGSPSKVSPQPMPQAKRLAGAQFTPEHSSFGKLTELMDEGLPIEKLR